MTKKESNEDKLIKKINAVNEQMKEIQHDPIKKNDRKKSKKVSEKNPELKEELTVPEIKENKTNIFGTFEIIIIITIFALIFLVIGYFVGNKNQKNENQNYTSVSKEIQMFIDEYNNILQNYYGDINKDEIIQSAIKGMLSSLDEYSGFIDDNSNSFNITLDGSYEGLGIEVSNDKEGNIVIRKVYEDTPASKAGLKENDVIIKFNDKELIKKNSNDLVKMISEVKEMKLTVKRNEDVTEFSLTKGKITLKSVEHKMLENNIGYIGVSIFANNTYEQFIEALNDLENQGMKKLIIDVRGNGGGYLSAVEKMLDLFVDASHIIYQTENKGTTDKVYSNGTKNREYPIVILQDGTSASASEVLSSSLKENLNAYIIGKTSFGKGTVQKLQTVPGLGEYKFTTSKWLTPKGNWINGVGIVPDLEVSLGKEHLENPVDENDNQLKLAIDYLNK